MTRHDWTVSRTVTLSPRVWSPQSCLSVMASLSFTSFPHSSSWSLQPNVSGLVSWLATVAHAHVIYTCCVCLPCSSSPADEILKQLHASPVLSWRNRKQCGGQDNLSSTLLPRSRSEAEQPVAKDKVGCGRIQTHRPCSILLGLSQILCLLSYFHTTTYISTTT